MLTLLIQTVFPQAGIALWVDTDEVFSVEWASQKDELQKLLPNIENLLKKAGSADDGGAGWGGIGKIVIVVGVGNFSSTRISVTIANMLGLMTKAELFELKLDEQMPIEDLVKLVRSKKDWQAVKLAKPIYKTAPMISKSKKQAFES